MFCINSTIYDCSSSFYKHLLHRQYKSVGRVSGNTDSTNVHHFSGTSPRPRVSREACHAVLGFCDVCLRQKYGSRLGHASLTACTACSARRIRESEASRLTRGMPCCSRLPRCLPPAEIRFTPRPCKPDGLHCLFRPSYPGVRGLPAHARHAMLFSASAMFTSGRNTVHASAMQA